MHHYLRTMSAAFIAAFATTAAGSSDIIGLKVTIPGLGKAGRLPDKAAFCAPSTVSGNNISPPVTWSAGPGGTRSYVLLMTDPDVPKDFSQINKSGVVIHRNDPRVSVFHWVLVDIPADLRSLAEGIESAGLVPHGKPVGETAHGRRGANVYSSFLASDAEMAGTYGGYDGPCPPVNDERPHRYVLQVFALDVPSLGLGGVFDGETVTKAMRGHILSTGIATATYSLNPSITRQQHGQ
ncbi:MULTISPECIES: YbhB/YbcL family Raf kinase inhibitor-like protein [unclassified Rhizobium]|jgi:Raf kinase inhibitor-like YbhB/YbcL family protein|uniref:YbhB/YbcL family Raf kinase inhibitor-like protein n=1 Tax=unclassified Rhizobium TaxID=2613769 RepID=UPI0010297CF3|nr:YbhB/YbcL family Raf kinase inhibitor-like protein [Rhizobium sp. BG4]QRM47383.1 YbhB/YbcL family Raf kinase inhibitor-like protein [Rhizobium sp. BG4]